MDPRERENLLIEANLLCTRGKFEQAQKLLEQIRHAFPGDNDAWYLLERIRATKEIEKDHDYRMRTARHTLGMHTSFNRLCWWIGSIILIIWSSWSLIDAIKNGLNLGFGALIQHEWSSRRGVSYYYTTAYADVILASLGILIAVALAILLLTVSRGASQWEEMDGPFEPPNFRYR